MSKPSDERSFAVFWGEFGRTYLAVCLRVAWQLPLAVLVAGFLARLLQCYGSEEVKREIACAALNHPWAMVLSWVEFIPYVFLLMPIGVLPILFLEWLKYRKDEPSAFTHGRWTHPNRPWTLANLKRLADNIPWRDQKGLEAHKINDFHSRITGNLTEADAIRFGKSFVKRLTTFMPKPDEQTADRLHWRIRVVSGDELDVLLSRSHVGSVTWTLRVEFYEWAGRKNPPRLAHTYITEFVCSGPSSTQP